MDFRILSILDFLGRLVVLKEKVKAAAENVMAVAENVMAAAEMAAAENVMAAVMVSGTYEFRSRCNQYQVSIWHTHFPDHRRRTFHPDYIECNFPRTLPLVVRHFHT